MFCCCCCFLSKEELFAYTCIMHCLQVPDKHRMMMHSKIMPLLRAESNVGKKYPDQGPLIVLWSRDDQLDNRPGTVFQPNHVVPLIISSESTDASSQKRRAKDHDCTSANNNKKRKGIYKLIV